MGGEYMATQASRRDLLLTSPLLTGLSRGRHTSVQLES